MDVPAAFGPTVRTKEDRIVRTHQPSEAVFGTIPPDDIDWKPFAAFPFVGN